MGLLCVLLFLRAHEHIYFMECALSQNVLLPLLMVHFVTRMYYYYYYYYYDGIILKNDRIIIPNALRKTILEKIHSSHLGITGCLRRARENVYWPNMTNNIKEYVSLCSTCKSYETANAKEPLLPHDIPDRIWAKVGIDLFSLNNQDYLISLRQTN